MKIHLLSDLHLEFYHDPEYVLERLIYPTNVLVLAGDIAVGFKAVDRAVNQLAPHYEHILFVPGNHEYYNSTMREFDNKQFSAPNAHILNPGIKRIICGNQDITFIGATLWTNFNNNPLDEFHAKDMISDFSVIKGFRPQDAKTYFNYESNFIKRMYETIPGKKIIVTHFLPNQECIHPKYKNSDLNSYFANNIDVSNLSNTPFWLCGHTHEEVNLNQGDTYILANPLGYPNERRLYHPLILELQ